MLHRILLAAFSILPVASLTVRADVLTQADSRARFGEKDFSYFYIEAEDFHDNNPRGDGEAWILSSEEDSLLQTVQEDFEPDPWAFASGGESITNAYEETTVTNNVGGGHDIQYLLNFDTAGDYYLYIRQHSPLGIENDRNKNDSFYYPIEFGEDPIQNKANGDDYGMLESIEFPGDVFQRGPWVWFAARQFVENSEQDPPIDQDPDTFQIYEVSEAMLGQDLVLEFDHRENGTMLDAFLFVSVDANLPPTNGEGPDGDGFFGIGDMVDQEFGLQNLGAATIAGDFDADGELTASDIDRLNAALRDASTDLQYDLTGDGTVGDADRTEWVEVLKFTYFGDANLDLEFNSGDLVTVLASGAYEVDTDSSWAQGDFNGDGRTTSGDLVTALAGGGYEQGPRAATRAIPEPANTILIATGLPLCGALGRRRRVQTARGKRSRRRPGAKTNHDSAFHDSQA